MKVKRSEADMKRVSGYRSLSGRSNHPPTNRCEHCESMITTTTVGGEKNRHECGLYEHRVNAYFGTCPHHSAIIGRHWITGRPQLMSHIPDEAYLEWANREACKRMIEWLDRAGYADLITTAERRYAQGEAA